MLSFGELAKNYGATTWGNGRGLKVVCVPTPCPAHVDIGFGRRELTFLGRAIPPFRRHKISDDIFIYGSCAKALHPLIVEDCELCSAIGLLLGRYAYGIDWSGQEVSARINLYTATPDGDETGGEKFLSSLAKIANRLSEIGRTSEQAMRSKSGWGPGRARNLSFFLGLTVPLIFALFATKFLFHR